MTCDLTWTCDYVTCKYVKSVHVWWAARKLSKLFARYARSSVASAAVVSQPITPLAEYQKYLTICNCDYDGDDDCLTFWHKHKKELPTLYKVAMKVHSVPATSAPIERVFSHGGVIMRPHRGRLLDSTLSNLVFLKCNNIWTFSSSTSLRVLCRLSLSRNRISYRRAVLVRARSFDLRSD